MGEIVDNAPELDLSDPKTTELLDSLKSDSPEKTEDKGVKEKVEVSPTPILEEQEDEPQDKDAVIKGLRAELNRRQGNADRVHELELELARLEGERKVKETPAENPLEKAIQALGDEDLLSKQTEWETELALASAKYERADEAGNDVGMRQALDRLQRAKEMLTRFRKESLSRGERRANERRAQETEVQAIEAELSGMYEAVNEAFPDFQDQGSDLWKAGNEEFLANPALMKRMGAAGEVVAAALAIVKNPNLTKGNAAATRRDVISKIDKGLGKALQGGTSSPNFSRNTNFGEAVTTGEGLAKFNEMIDKVKAG